MILVTGQRRLQCGNIFKKLMCIYFWLHWVFVAAHGIFLVATSRGYSLIAMHGFLIAVAPLVVQYEL